MEQIDEKQKIKKRRTERDGVMGIVGINCSNAKSTNAEGKTTRKNDNKHFGEWIISSYYFSSCSFRLWFVHYLKRRQAMLKI